MPTLGIGPRGRQVRAGGSLVELLVALSLFGIVGGATLRALDHQARFHSGAMVILESRAQHAAAHEALAVGLRSVSTAAGDVGRLSDSAIVFRLPAGAGVACAITPGTIDFAPDSVAAGQSFARFRVAPQPGDTAWVFDEGPTESAADDAWAGAAVQSAGRSTGRCPGSPLVDSVADAGRSSWRLTLSGATLPATVRAGAPLRLTRLARFALYRGGTGESWLGFAEWQAATGSWVAIQPVSGPYLPFRPGQPSASGVALAGRDSSGTAAPGVGGGLPTALAVTTRTLSSRVVRMDGLARGRYADSLQSLIGMRNSR